jgi:uncharacterized membrane protein YtjA (UPF0391 family)
LNVRWPKEALIEGPFAFAGMGSFFSGVAGVIFLIMVFLFWCSILLFNILEMTDCPYKYLLLMGRQIPHRPPRKMSLFIQKPAEKIQLTPKPLRHWQRVLRPAAPCRHAAHPYLGLD